MRTDGVLVQRLEADAAGVHLEIIDQSGGRGRYEVLLDSRPFVLPENLVLRYPRSDPAVHVDLVFDDGAHLHDVLPPPEGLTVEVSLARYAGRRVDESTLVYIGGAARLNVTLGDLTITPDDR